MGGQLINQVWQPRSDSLAPRRFRGSAGTTPSSLIGSSARNSTYQSMSRLYLSEGEAAIQRLQERNDQLLVRWLTYSCAVSRSHLRELKACRSTPEDLPEPRHGSVQGDESARELEK